MLNRRFFSGVMVISALVYLGLTAEVEAGSTKKAKSRGRSLASVSPVTAKMGQGEQMLYGVTKSSPEFVKSKSARRDAVQIKGVCRDSYGVVYTSTDRNYASCIDSATKTTSVPTAVQPQAGAAVGVRLGQ